MRVKICGITQLEQGRAIAALGATDLGFICVPQSRRYLNPSQIGAIARQLPPGVGKIGVFAGATLEEICQVVREAELTGVQLHGGEPPPFCQRLRQLLPGPEAIFACRVRDSQSLARLPAYFPWIDTLLLDAYHPRQLGGTGQTLDWQALSQFAPPLPWLLAGGLTPENVLQALTHLNPNGIDLSSGVERAPGDKDLARVARLFDQLGAAPPCL